MGQMSFIYKGLDMMVRFCDGWRLSYLSIPEPLEQGILKEE